MVGNIRFRLLVNEVTRKVTELKTLKELIFFYGDTELVYADDLHEEIIKRIKSLNKNRSSNAKYTKEELTGIVKWIKQFFNITEEDLE